MKKTFALITVFAVFASLSLVPGSMGDAPSVGDSLSSFRSRLDISPYMVRSTSGEESTEAKTEKGCPDVSVDEVKAIVATFQQSLQSKDVDGAVDLWTEAGRLLGTVDESFTVPGVRIGREEVKDYFVGFIGDRSPYKSVDPKFVTEIDERSLQQLGNGIASFSGYWDIDFITQDDQAIIGYAKFTFIFQRQQDTGDLKILLLNSGLTPRGLTPIE
jgi:hypothetical protein